MKKIISIILIMLICLLSLSSCKDEDIVFEFEKNSDLTCTLTGVKTNGQPIDV